MWYSDCVTWPQQLFLALQCGLCIFIFVLHRMLTFATALSTSLCSAGCICACGGPFASFHPLVGQCSLSIAPGLVGGLSLQAVKPTVELQTI